MENHLSLWDIPHIVSRYVDSLPPNRRTLCVTHRVVRVDDKGNELKVAPGSKSFYVDTIGVATKKNENVTQYPPCFGRPDEREKGGENQYAVVGMSSTGEVFVIGDFLVYSLHCGTYSAEVDKQGVRFSRAYSFVDRGETHNMLESFSVSRIDNVF